jgi:hypothetical protein
MGKKVCFVMTALFLAVSLMIVPVWAGGNEEGTSLSSGPKPYTGQPPTDLVGVWTGTWDNRCGTTATMTISTVSATELKGHYKHSGTSETRPGEYDFSAPLQEKGGKCCFVVKSLTTGREMLFILRDGKLHGEWSNASVTLKKK